MHVLVIATSLNPDSRSAVLARAASEMIEQRAEGETTVELIDLRDHELPHCDGDTAYQHPTVELLATAGTRADLILLAVPIYNYDVNAAAKTVVELSGRSWSEKTVGFLCAAGGRGSYMSVMGVANSLMLDFRCVIVPRFVYATGSDFHGDGSLDLELQTRLQGLVDQSIRLASAVCGSVENSTAKAEAS